MATQPTPQEIIRNYTEHIYKKHTKVSEAHTIMAGTFQALVLGLLETDPDDLENTQRIAIKILNERK